MTVENTNGDARPADVTTQQTGVDAADEGVSALEQMVVDGEAPATEQENAQDEAPEADATPENDADDEAGSEDGEEEDSEESESDEEEPEAEHAHKGARAEKRIHKLTAQRNEVREKLEAAQKRLEAAEAAANSSIGLRPEYLKPDQIQAVQQANALIERKQFLMSHIGVGFEDESDPSKSLTAKQVAEELVKIDRMSGHISEAQRIYDEAKRQQLEDMKAGRMLRLSKQALTKNKKHVPTVKATTPSATAARSAASSHVQRRGMNVDRFHKSGGSEEAALRELEELVPG